MEMNDVELYRCVSEGDLQLAKDFFGRHPDEFRRGYREHQSWLDIAVSGGHRPMVEWILFLGADVNEGSRRNQDETPLWSALGVDNPGLAGLLLEKGADATRGRYVISAITGLKKHSLELLKLLERHGADIHKVFLNEMTGDPMNALSAAIAWGRDDVADYLRSRGAVLPERPKPELASPNDQSESSTEVIRYFTDNFGPVHPLVQIEILPSWPPISVHIIPPSEERPCVTLFTTGMSDEPMNVPKGEENYTLAEVFMQLPASWNYRDLSDPSQFWPFLWLRSSAQYPHLNETWLGGPVAIIANGDPPRPLAPELPFTCVLLMALQSFVRKDGKTVQLYRMIPLYTAERDLEAKEGVAALMHSLDRHAVSFIVDVNRPNVAIK